MSDPRTTKVIEKELRHKEILTTERERNLPIPEVSDQLITNPIPQVIKINHSGKVEDLQYPEVAGEEDVVLSTPETQEFGKGEMLHEDSWRKMTRKSMVKQVKLRKIPSSRQNIVGNEERNQIGC